MRLVSEAVMVNAESIAQKPSHPKLNNVQVLRGLAALAVVFYHLGLNHRVKFPQFVPFITAYGKYGVQAFFVLSGFILPWSMNRSGYQLSDFGRFLLKRILRLDPPYLISIILSIAFLLAAARSGGESVHITVFQVLAHLGYLNVFFNMWWLNPVYWTLAVEMQFYLLIALIFPILNKPYRILIFVAMAVAPLVIRSQYFLPHHMALFLLGMGIYLVKSGSVDRRIAAAWTIGSIVLLRLQLAPAEALAGLAGALLLFAPEIKSGWLEWLGNISFSLYLVHYHVGNKAQSLMAPWLPWYVTYVAGIAASLAVAYALYRLVELPAQRWASAVKYVVHQPKSRPDSSNVGFPRIDTLPSVSITPHL